MYDYDKNFSTVDYYGNALKPLGSSSIFAILLFCGGNYQVFSCQKY